MTDIGHTVTPKSDQLNSDDLIAGPMTCTISRVTAANNTADQPVSLFFNEGARPYKPCKSMRRVLISIWGSNGSDYIGRRLTLYRDPAVKYGGIAVGGIRISHMSDMGDAATIMLTASRSTRAPFNVLPLAADAYVIGDEVYTVGSEVYADLMQWSHRFGELIAHPKFDAVAAARALDRHRALFERMRTGDASEQAAANAVSTALELKAKPDGTQ